MPVIKSMKVTFPEIQHAVSDNAKQRFAMKAAPDAPTPPSDTDPSQYLIRANQGHSIASVASENLLKPLTLDTLPPTIVHGSYYALYPLILESGGLKAMSRNQIHFSIGLPEDRESNVISGMRNDAELLFYVDAAKAMRDDVKWWISDNGVVLSEGDAEGCIGPKYWKKVEGRKGGVGVLWEEGVEVAKIPEGVRGKKVPVGKARGEKK